MYNVQNFVIVHTESKESRCFTNVVAWVTFLAFYYINDIGWIAVVVARSHGYVGSWYFQTRSGVNYVANLASRFHAFFVTGNGWCSGDSCLDEHLSKVGRLSKCAKRSAAEQVFGGRHVAVAFPFFHDSFVNGDNGRMVCCIYIYIYVFILYIYVITLYTYFSYIYILFI